MASFMLEMVPLFQPDVSCGQNWDDDDDAAAAAADVDSDFPGWQYHFNRGCMHFLEANHHLDADTCLNTYLWSI